MDPIDTRVGPVAVDRRGDGTPMLLLHANGHDHHDYDGLVARLGGRFATVALDWPGSGASPAPSPPGQASPALFADVLDDVVRALALPPAVIVGNSVGGMAAVRLAARRPERVAALVLVNSGGFTPMGLVPRLFCAMQAWRWVRRRTGVAFAKRYLRERTPEVEDILARLARTRGRPDAVAVEAALWRAFPRPESDVHADAAQVRCPTLLVWGARDPVSRVRVEGRRAQRAIPHAEWCELPCGHSAFAELPERFVHELLAFLDRTMAGRRAAS